MIKARSSIPVLRFCAGNLDLGIAAEDVISVRPPVKDTPHIASMLGIEASSELASRRNVHVMSDTSRSLLGFAGITFQVDPPVYVVRCRADDILSALSGAVMAKDSPIMGFAHIDDVLITLLDIPSVVETFLNARKGGQVQ